MDFYVVLEYKTLTSQYFSLVFMYIIKSLLSNQQFCKSIENQSNLSNYDQGLRQTDTLKTIFPTNLSMGINIR
jgi:hypothetical protein